MALSVTFYKSEDTDIKMFKSFTNPVVKSVTLKEGCSILDPVLKVGYDSSIINHNYVDIPAFGRRYKVTARNVTIGQEIILTLHVDVLYSHSNYILNSEGRITRSGNMGDAYMVDSMVTLDDKFDLQVRKLGNGFSKADNYIMIVGGSN